MMKARSIERWNKIQVQGREFVNYEWRDIPKGQEQLFCVNPYAEVQCEYCRKANQETFECRYCGAQLAKRPIFYMIPEIKRYMETID